MANKSTTYYRYLQQQQEEQKTNDIYINFVNSLDSSASRMAYLNAFEQFMRFCNMHSYEQMLELAKSGEEGTTKILESKIRDFIIWLREDVKRSQSTVMTYSAAISHFYQMNDVIINWKKLKKFKGKMRNVVQDVPYTREQIKKLIDGATLRNSCIILLMASAGLRRGAIPDLQLQDLEKITKYDLYKITVYRREKEEYITYCSPECTKLIDRYLEWRIRLGEVIKPTTPLFRKEFDTTSPMQIAGVKPLVIKTMSTMIASLADRTGVRSKTKLPYSKTNLMQCHGFRKFFDTQCISHNMNPLYCEYLMGHRSGLIKSYFKPTNMELLEGNEKSLGYIAMIPYLTINATEEENDKLRNQLQKLRGEQDHITQLRIEIEKIKALIRDKPMNEGN